MFFFFICCLQADDDGTGSVTGDPGVTNPSEDNAEVDDPEPEGASWVVYFWQGRKAPNMGWLTFTFGLERKFKQLCRRLDVVRTHQQQESLKFMAHFRRRFIIRDGKRNLKPVCLTKTQFLL